MHAKLCFYASQDIGLVLASETTWPDEAWQLWKEMTLKSTHTYTHTHTRTKITEKQPSAPVIKLPHIFIHELLFVV